MKSFEATAKSGIAGNAKINNCANKLIEDCKLDRYPPLPQIFRKAELRIALELHMDDFHGSRKKSEVEVLLRDVMAIVKFKALEATTNFKYIKFIQEL